LIRERKASASVVRDPPPLAAFSEYLDYFLGILFSQQGDKLNVFISYSRDDLAFADQLRAALLGYDFTLTIDRESITSGEDWKKRLGLLIRDADTIVFVLSPSSVRSSTCAWEAEEAVRLGKRILPILCRSLGDASPPPELAALQYTYFYDEPKFPGSGFGTGLNSLRLALNTDPDWLGEHTRYFRLSKEWGDVGKPSDRRLLSATDIALAKRGAADRPEKAREITPLQLDFIGASEAEDLRQRNAEAQRLRRPPSSIVEPRKLPRKRPISCSFSSIGLIGHSPNQSIAP
jgi:TIR domain